jgi:LacI family transcriptional regulator
MQDVANKAGVSRTTVSYVINDVPNSNIPAATKKRIWSAVNELGYRSNAIARGLRGGKSNVLGLITDNIADAAFGVDIIRGVQETALSKNKMVLVMDGDNDPKTTEVIFQMMAEWQVEGTIYASLTHREIETPPCFHYSKTILVDCYSKENDLPSVIPDERQGGYAATTHLLAKRHRRVGIINGKPGYQATIGRLEGYKQALADYQIPIDEELIYFGDWWQDEGYKGVMDIMGKPKPPTAFFCGNDRLAIGAIEAIKELGFRIPEDIAVIGFDNQLLIAEHSRPRLTTVALPYYQMGQWAVEHLLKEDQRQDASVPMIQKLACPLVERSSA